MIIKRPYAFLIKHFKIIHVILLVICSFILFKNSTITTFVNDFTNYGVYDSMNNPITKYIPIYLFILLFVVSILNTIVVLLLKYKDKPWKLYLFPTITYIGLIIMYSLILVYFNGYNGVFERTQVSLYKDLLNLLSIFQLPSLLVYLIRVLGLDLKKFNFQNDAEYLELDEKDQMELEININIDKASFKRTFRRFKRNLGYFVEEHKRLVIGTAAIILLVIGYNVYKTTFITNKIYKQNDEYSANGYTFKIKNVYYTNKNKSGKVIDKSLSFVIVQLSVRNNLNDTEFKTDGFHLYNGVNNYSDISNKYAPDFDDFGKIYTQKTTIRKDETMDIILIYRVDKKLDKDSFVLFYQEKYGNNKLRKIKIKVTDVSTIKDNGTLKLGEEIKYPYVRDGEQTIENLAPDSFKLDDSADFTVKDCDEGICINDRRTLEAPDGYKVAIISYMTEEFESKDIIDFSSKYGKINYIDSKNKKHSVAMENSTTYDSYLGQYAYVLVPEEITNSPSIELVYTIRNNKYTYKVKG